MEELEKEKTGTMDGATILNNPTDGDAGTDTAGDPQESPTLPGTAVTRLGRFRERWQNPHYRRNVWRTVWLGFSFWGLGFSVAQRGPAFLDLQIITGTDVERASYFFTAYSAGYMTGSMAAGVIYDLLNKSLLLVLSVAGLGASTIALPWCSPFWLMIAINFVSAVFVGAVDTTLNAELLRLWDKDGEMALQFLHFTFAFGGVMGPLATEPFLTPNPEDNATVTIPITNRTTTNITTAPITPTTTIFTKVSLPPSMALNNVNALWNTSALELETNSTVSPLPLTTNVHYAFLISGTVILLGVVPFMVQLFSDRSQKRRRQGKKDYKQKSDDKQPLPLKLFLFVMAMLCLYYVILSSAEDTSIDFLTTFVVKQLHWSKSSGALLSTVFWTTYASFRFLSIFLAYALTPAKLLGLSLVSVVLAQVSMLLFAAHGIDTGIWVSAVFVGSAVAAIFPTGFTWMREELVRVTGRVTGSIFVSTSLGNIVMPILVGYLVQEVSPMWYCYILVLLSSLSLTVFLFLLALSRLYLWKHHAVRNGSKATHEVTVVPSILQESKDSGNSVV